MFERLSLSSLADAVDGAWGLLESGSRAAGDACAALSTLAGDAVAGLPAPSFDWVPTFDWMPDTSPLPLLEWLFSGGTAVPEIAPGPVSAECGAGAGMSGAGLDHFFPKADRDWSTQVDGDGLARFLRAAHPAKTAIHVAARTRLPADTVKKWLAGAALPNGRAVLVLACCYGPELLCAMLRDPPGWLDASARGAAQARINATVATGEARAAAGSNRLTWTGRGRRFDRAWIGRKLWFDRAAYRVAAVDGDALTLTRADGAAFTFPADVTEVFYLGFVYGEGTCAVSGATVRRIQGDPFLLYVGDPAFEFRIAGVARRVVGFTDTETLTLDGAIGDRTDAPYRFWTDINDGQIATLRLHRTESDAENLSLYTRYDGSWIQNQFGSYGRYRPLRISTGELPYAIGSPCAQLCLYPEALVLGGDYGWDALRILTPQQQPANYLLTQAGPPGQAVGFASRGRDTEVGFYLDVQGQAPIVFSADAFGSVAAKVIPQAGAVAYPQLLNAAAGGRVTLSAAADAHIDAGLLLSGQGAGGTLIEAASDGSLGFFGVPPVAKQPGPDIQRDGVSQLADVIDAVNQLRAALFAYGLIH